jgi:hypothetical protein
MTRTLLVTALALAAGCGNKSDKPADTKGSAQDPTPQPTEPAPAGAGSEAKPVEGSAAPVAPPATGPAWQKHTSKDGGFTMDFPGKVEEKDQGGLMIAGAEFGATATDPRTSLCGAAFLKLPAADDPKAILDGATASHKQEATVIEDKEVTLGKSPGRSIIIENTQHRKWMRVYLVDKVLYVLNCGGPFDRAATDGPIALKALASFALTK